jgi:acid phosphatase type 7
VGRSATNLREPGRSHGGTVAVVSDPSTAGSCMLTMRSLRLLTSVVLLTPLFATKAVAVEVVAAGDIATSGSGDTQTSNRVLAIDPALVLTRGDHAYPSGTLSQFNTYYDPTWGRFKAITRPSPGNHDWLTSGAAGYESYFGVQAGQIRSFVVGDWRVIAMDSNVNISGQTSALATALRTDGHRCELLYFHHPRWSSGEHGNNSRVGPWWTTAYAQGVDVILNGHDHDYERFNKKAPSGAYADDGIREFVVGTGGVATRPFGSTVSGSEKRITGNSHWGVLRLDLWTKSYSWKFIDADSGGVLDSGSTSCHS